MKTANAFLLAGLAFLLIGVCGVATFLASPSKTDSVVIEAILPDRVEAGTQQSLVIQITNKNTFEIRVVGLTMC